MAARVMSADGLKVVAVVSSDTPRFQRLMMAVHDIATRYHHCCARYHGSRRCDQPLRSSQAGTGTLPRCVHAGA